MAQPSRSGGALRVEDERRSLNDAGSGIREEVTAFDEGRPERGLPAEGQGGVHTRAGARTGVDPEPLRTPKPTAPLDRTTDAPPRIPNWERGRASTAQSDARWEGAYETTPPDVPVHAPPHTPAADLRRSRAVVTMAVLLCFLAAVIAGAAIVSAFHNPTAPTVRPSGGFDPRSLASLRSPVAGGHHHAAEDATTTAQFVTRRHFGHSHAHKRLRDRQPLCGVAAALPNDPRGTPPCRPRPGRPLTVFTSLVGRDATAFCSPSTCCRPSVWARTLPSSARGRPNSSRPSAKSDGHWAQRPAEEQYRADTNFSVPSDPAYLGIANPGRTPLGDEDAMELALAPKHGGRRGGRGSRRCGGADRRERRGSPPQRARGCRRPDRTRRDPGPPRCRRRRGRVAALRAHARRHPRAVPHVRRRTGGGACAPGRLRGERPASWGLRHALQPLLPIPGSTTKLEVRGGVQDAESAALLSSFFAGKRPARRSGGTNRLGRRRLIAVRRYPPDLALRARQCSRSASSRFRTRSERLASRPEECESGRIGRSRKPLCLMGTVGSNPPSSAQGRRGRHRTGGCGKEHRQGQAPCRQDLAAPQRTGKE